jgi:hypothetical protein
MLVLTLCCNFMYLFSFAAVKDGQLFPGRKLKLPLSPTAEHVPAWVKRNGHLEKLAWVKRNGHLENVVHCKEGR